MLPSSPPPVRAYFEHREANERDVARPLRWPAMTSPVLVAGRIAVALLEVEAGFRPGHQLERHCHPTLWDRLAPGCASAVARQSPAAASGACSSRSTSQGWWTRSPFWSEAAASRRWPCALTAPPPRSSPASCRPARSRTSTPPRCPTPRSRRWPPASRCCWRRPRWPPGSPRLRNHKLATSVPNAASARTSTSSSATPRAARSAPGRWRPWPSTPPAATRYSRRTVAGPWPTAPPAAAAATALQQGTRQHLGQWCGLSVEIAPTQGRDRPHPGLGSQCPRGHRPGGLPARGVVRGPPELAAAGPAVAHPDQP